MHLQNMNPKGSDHETVKVFSRKYFYMMHLLLATLKNSEWLTYFSYPSTAEKCDTQESKEQAGEITEMKCPWKKPIGTGQTGLCTEMCHIHIGKSQDRGQSFSIIEHHITIPSRGLTGDLVNKSTKLLVQ